MNVLSAAAEPMSDAAEPDEIEWKRPGRGRDVLIWLLRAGVLLGAIVGWDLAVRAGLVDDFFVSTPSAVWDFLTEFISSGMAWEHIWATMQSILLGFLAGSALGLVAGILFAAVPLLSSVFGPFFVALNAVPRVALAPLFVLWFGIGLESKIFLAVSLVFFIVQLGTESALRNADPELVNMARLMGADKSQLYRKVVLPAAIPVIFASLRLGLVYTLLAVVFGEMVAAERGLGQRIQYYAGTFNAAGVFGVLVILVIIALAINAVVSGLEKWLVGRFDPQSRKA